MAFIDVLGGLAGGLSQGLGQVQQNVETRRRNEATSKELALRAMQEQRAAEEAARRAYFEQHAALEDGVEIDPTMPDVAAMIKTVGPGAYVKGKSGKGLMKKPKAQNVLAEQQLEEFGKNRPLREATSALELDEATARKQLMDGMIAQYGPDWRRKMVGNEQIPMQARQAAAMILGKNPEWFLSPQEKLRYSESVGAAAVTAAGMRDMRQAQIGNMTVDNIAQENAAFDRFVASDPGMLELMRKYGGDIQKMKADYMMQRGVRPAPAQTPGGVQMYDSNGKPIS